MIGQDQAKISGVSGLFTDQMFAGRWGDSQKTCDPLCLVLELCACVYMCVCGVCVFFCMCESAHSPQAG